MNVFISHASDDAAIAKRIEELIAYDGYQSWRFQRDMVGANPADPQLPSNIKSSEIFLFCISDHSQESETCQKELEHASLLQKPLVTVRLNRETLVPSPLNDHQWVDFDESPVSTVQLVKALRNAKPLRWDMIPSNWTTWEGRSKSELSAGQIITSEIPLPRIRQDLTDREKEEFLRNSLTKIRAYFGRALGKFDESYSQVQIKILITSDSEFSFQINVKDKVKKGCRIWIYNQYGINGIAYYKSAGRTAIFGKHPYNELAKVAELDGNPALRFTRELAMFTHHGTRKICTVDKAAECLWKHFIRDFDETSPNW